MLEMPAARLVQVQGKTKEEWAAFPRKTWEYVSVNTMLLNDWEVLEKVHAEPTLV